MGRAQGRQAELHYPGTGGMLAESMEAASSVQPLGPATIEAGLEAVTSMVLRVRIRRMGKSRPGLFTLRAEPRLRQDELLRGYLDYIVFTAETTRGFFMWHAHRHSSLIPDFRALVSEEEAIRLVRELHQGHSIELSGRHKLELLQGRFGFEGRDGASDAMTE